MTIPPHDPAAIATVRFASRTHNRVGFQGADNHAFKEIQARLDDFVNATFRRHGDLFTSWESSFQGYKEAHPQYFRAPELSNLHLVNSGVMVETLADYFNAGKRDGRRYPAYNFLAHEGRHTPLSLKLLMRSLREPTGEIGRTLSWPGVEDSGDLLKQTLHDLCFDETVPTGRLFGGESELTHPYLAANTAVALLQKYIKHEWKPETTEGTPQHYTFTQLLPHADSATALARSLQHLSPREMVELMRELIPEEDYERVLAKANPGLYLTTILQTYGRQPDEAIKVFNGLNRMLAGRIAGHEAYELGFDAQPRKNRVRIYGVTAAALASLMLATSGGMPLLSGPNSIFRFDGCASLSQLRPKVDNTPTMGSVVVLVFDPPDGSICYKPNQITPIRLVVGSPGNSVVVGGYLASNRPESDVPPRAWLVTALPPQAPGQDPSQPVPVKILDEQNNEIGSFTAAPAPGGEAPGNLRVWEGFDIYKRTIQSFFNDDMNAILRGGTYRSLPAFDVGRFRTWGKYLRDSVDQNGQVRPESILPLPDNPGEARNTFSIGFLPEISAEGRPLLAQVMTFPSSESPPPPGPPVKAQISGTILHLEYNEQERIQTIAIAPDKTRISVIVFRTEHPIAFLPGPNDERIPARVGENVNIARGFFWKETAGDDEDGVVRSIANTAVVSLEIVPDRNGEHATF